MKKIIRLIMVILFLSGMQNSGLPCGPICRNPDVDGIAPVDMTDYNIVLTDANNFVIGSSTTDLDCDSFTDLCDVIYVWNAFH